jgi:hypothetical protein
MPRLRLESATDAFDLNSVAETGFGVEALSGVTGLGLPPVQVQWAEGAGDGAVFRGRRVQPRDIDIPIYARARNRAELRAMMARASKMLAGQVRLWFVEDEGDRWYLDMHRIGGGQYVYGADTTGETELRTVVTLRAGDPFWTSEVADQRVISRATVGKGLIKDVVGGNTGADSLTHLRLSSAQILGAIFLENTGDAESFPSWEIQGPGSDIIATGPAGDVWHWTGTLDVDETLFIDSRTARAVDNTGASRYSEFAASPRFWTVPPGISNANVTMTGTGRIVVTWNRRKWAVI